jgi:mannose-6-phosphate isomerase
MNTGTRAPGDTSKPAMEATAVQPILLEPNQPALFYRGGESIARFRNVPLTSVYRPEDWIGSTTTLFGSDRGPSLLPDGRSLQAAIGEDPGSFLGADHVESFGTDAGLLVKLLDAGERLPVHLHPPRAFAQEHLGCAHGKTEAWVVIGTSVPNPEVYLGFREALSAQTLTELVAEQGQGDLLKALVAVPVQVGDVFFVPAGTPHSIGAGVFIVELQEPTDFSIMMEFARYGMDGEQRGSLGIGFEKALTCVDRTAWNAARVAAAKGPRWSGDRGTRGSILPDAAADFFRAELVRPGVDGAIDLEASFAILVVLDGAGTVTTSSGDTLDIKRGDTVLMPYSAGTSAVSGPVTLLRCQPPTPDRRL